MNKLIDEIELLSKPGDTILETIKCLGISQDKLAERMGRKPSEISRLLSGKEPITSATALQLEKILGIDAEFWINGERLYREKVSILDEALQSLKESTTRDKKITHQIVIR